MENELVRLALQDSCDPARIPAQASRSPLRSRSPRVESKERQRVGVSFTIGIVGLGCHTECRLM